MSQTGSRDSSLSRRTLGFSIGNRTMPELSQTHNMESISNLRRGNLSWEIAYKKTNTFDPDAFAMLIWYIVLQLFVLYHVWVIPILICFLQIDSDPHKEWILYLLAMIAEIPFVIDIYVQMHTGFYIYGDLVRNAIITRRKYLVSMNFLLDLFALIPLPLLWTPPDNSRGIYLLNKLLRMRRLKTFTLAFDKVFARYFIFCKVVKLFTVLYFFCHYVACLYISFGIAHNVASSGSGHGASHFSGNNEEIWKLRIHSDEGHDILLTGYFASLFWALGLISKCVEGEIPRTLLQTLFMLFIMFGGFLLFVYICGTLFMISKCDANSSERFNAKINQLRYVLSFHNIPKDIQHRAIEYLENGFKSGEANDRNTIKLLCPSIAKDVKFTLLKDIVSNVPFFKCCHAAFIRALVDLMEAQSLPTNFVVCNKGDVGEDMYFVQSGVLTVFLDDIKVSDLRKGAFFGELALFTNNPRPTSVLTTTFCIVHKLSRTHVRRVLRAYPQFESQILLCVKAHLNELDVHHNKTMKRILSQKGIVEPPSKDLVQKFEPHADLRKNTITSIDTSKRDLSAAHKASTKTKLQQFNLPRWRGVSPKSLLLCTAIHHKSSKRLIWLLCVMTTTLYNLFTVPLLIVFDLMGYPWHFFFLNTLGDTILWLDIYGKFNLSYVYEAEEITDTWKCAVHYLKTNFKFDILCAFPWWLLYPQQHLQLRCARLLRIMALPSELEELTEFFGLNSRHRIFILGLVLFFCYHVAGCMAHSLTFALGFGDVEFGWLPPKFLSMKLIYNSTTGEPIGYDYMNGARLVGLDDSFVNDIILKQYLRALQYGAVCLTNLGRVLEPESLSEFMLAFGLMLCGLMLISTIIDEVQKRVTASAVEQMEFLSNRSKVMHFLRKQKAPREIHQRVSLFLEFWWSAHRGADMNHLLSELPKSIKREIFGHICASLLSSIKKMKDIESQYEKVSNIFLDSMNVHLFGQGESIYNKGDYADAIFILLAGEVALVSTTRASKSIPRIAKQGDLFGCSSLCLDDECEVYSEFAVSRTACVVAILEQTVLSGLNEVYGSFTSELFRREQKLLAEHRAMTKLLERKELEELNGDSNPSSIDPDSTWVVVWDTCIFFGMAFQIVYIPILMAFGNTGNSIPVESFISDFLELMFLVDLYIKSKKGYYSFGNKVMKLSAIRKRYYHSLHFLIDLLAILPFQIANYINDELAGIWLINKLLRVFQLSSVIEDLEHQYFTINIQIRITKLVFYIFLLAHYIGCCWFNFASNITTIVGFTHESQFGKDMWLPDASMELTNNQTTAVFKYGRAFYWGIGLLVGFCKGGYPSNALEYIFTMTVQTLGVFMLAYVVGNLLDIVQVADGRNQLFYSNLNNVRKLTTYFNFTDDVKSKIQHYYFYRLFHSIHEEHVLAQCLSPSLVIDIRHFLLAPLLKKVPFFQDDTANANVMRSLVSHMSQVLVTRHDVVIRQNEPGVEMYFVFAGCLEVFVSNDKDQINHNLDLKSRGLKVNEIHSGSFFGERSLFSDQPRSASISAKTFCTLYKLSRTHVESVFQQHPHWKTKVMHIVAALNIRQTKNQREKIEQAESEVRASLKSKQDEYNSKNSSSRVAPKLKHKTSSLTESNEPRTVWVKRVKNCLQAIEVQSTCYRRYLKILCICQLYVALSVPYLLTFGQTNLTQAISYSVIVLDVLTDIVFAFDIWFKLHLVETTTSREFYEVRLSYSSSNMYLDIIAILPINYLLSSLVHPSVLLRFNRFIKLRQLNNTIKELNRFSMSYEINKLLLLALYYFLVCYWTACCYFGLTYVLGFSSEWNSSLPAVYFDSSLHGNHYDFTFSWHQFLRCFYFSLNLYTGVGMVYEPKAPIQYGFNIIMSVFGVFVMGYVIGEASTLVIYLIQNEVDFKINQMNVREFLARKKLDKVLHIRVHKYMTYWWTFQAGISHQTILEQLPSRIRAHANIEICRVGLSRFAIYYLRPLFVNSTFGVDGVVVSIAHRLVFESYPAGESVIVQGNIGHIMYFVARGTLTTASTAPEFTPSTYDDGQYFGDEGFLAGSFCSYSVVTLRACDLLSLSAADFLAALGEHPRTSECCFVAREIAAHHKKSTSRLESMQGLGKIVCTVVFDNLKKLKSLREMSVDTAEIMFDHFLCLFVRQTVKYMAHDENEKLDICQHCDSKSAEFYCKLCLQGLCQTCSDAVHIGTPFAFHLTTIKKREIQEVSANNLREELVGSRRNSISKLLDSFLGRHATSPTSNDISTATLDSSSSFLGTNLQKQPTKIIKRPQIVPQSDQAHRSSHQSIRGQSSSQSIRGQSSSHDANEDRSTESHSTRLSMKHSRNTLRSSFQKHQQDQLRVRGPSIGSTKISPEKISDQSETSNASRQSSELRSPSQAQRSVRVTVHIGSGVAKNSNADQTRPTMFRSYCRNIISRGEKQKHAKQINSNKTGGDLEPPASPDSDQDRKKQM